jgi:hypothetical protein
MSEPKVAVVGRKEDRTIIEGILNNVKQEYNEKTGVSVELKIDENNYLPPGPTPGHKGAAWYASLPPPSLGGAFT